MSISIRKDADGKRLLGMISSNAYRDRDHEFITLKALTDWVAKQWHGDTFKTDNVALFWHEGAPIGDIVYADMHGKMLIEIARERDTPYARAIFDMIEAHTEIEWGASVGGKAPFIQKLIGIFRTFHKHETSVLPRRAAANIYTYVGTSTMAKNKVREGLLKLLSPEAYALEQALAEQAEATEAELDKAGAVHKQAQTIDVTLEKGKIDLNALSEAVMAMVGELAGENAPQDLQARVEAAIDSAMLDEQQAPPEEFDDEEAVPPDDEQSQDDSAPPQEGAPEDDQKRDDDNMNKEHETKLTELLGELLLDLKAREDLTDVVEQLNALPEAVNKHVAPIGALTTQVGELVERMERVERILKGGTRAASRDAATEVDKDNPLLKHAQTMNIDPKLVSQFPGLFKQD